MTSEDLYNPDVAKAFAQRDAQSGMMAQRMYHSAKSSRLTQGWNQDNTSADAELSTSLRNLRNRSRSLVRDASYAKRARTLVVNNVVGTGIGLQAQVKTNDGKLNSRINDAIERVWENWCEPGSCHTGGRLHFSMLERMAMGQVFEAGEVFARQHSIAPGRSRVPLTLEMIEAERVPDELYMPFIGAIDPGNELRMGVELSTRFHRPISYYIRTNHPSDYRYVARQAVGKDWIERVDAADVYHLAVVDRWPQTRGEPWMHTALRRMNDMDGYSEAEIIRARGQALTMAVIETSEDPLSWGEKTDDGQYEFDLEAGSIKRLVPGEKMNFGSPSAPNPALDGFMRYMLREIAAGVEVSYESLSRDYSQSNYSSSRLALLDDRDLWRVFQKWFIVSFRQPLYVNWLTRAVLAGAIPELPIEVYASDPLKYQAVRYKPRGWTWIDPASEIDAYKDAVKAGFTTVTDVVAQTAGGMDIEDIADTREDELAFFEEKGLVFETSPEFYNAANELAENQQKMDKEAQDKQAAIARVAAANPPPVAPPVPTPTKVEAREARWNPSRR